MVTVGILYLVLEKKVLVKSKLPGDSTVSADNTLSRSLIGVQVRNELNNSKSSANLEQIGFIILAMIVTRSSALSLQAKLGLPRGNQIVGWNVLGMYFPRISRDLLTATSIVVDYATSASTSTKQQPLSPPVDGHLLDICASLRHPHNLLRRSLLSGLLYYIDHLGSTGTQRLLLHETQDSSDEWQCRDASFIIIFPV